MNSVVFQELRERRSLAYRAGASYDSPTYAQHPYTYSGYVSTQNDKLVETLSTFVGIVNQMPVSEGAFAVAKQSIENRLRTSRIKKDGVAWDYIESVELGNNHDVRADIYDRIQSLSLNDVERFQKDRISGKPLHIGILGNLQEMNLDELSKIGRVVVLTEEQLFGY